QGCRRCRGSTGTRPGTWARGPCGPCRLRDEPIVPGGSPPRRRDVIASAREARMAQLFAVIRTRGPAWQGSQPLEGQPDWAGDASFMNALAKEGFVVLGGPLEGTADTLLIVRATTPDEVRSRLAPIPGRAAISSASPGSRRGPCGSARWGAPLARDLGV